MIGEEAAQDAVERARRLPNLKVGLHIVLAEGTPVSPPDTIPDLIDREGRFPSDMVRAAFRFFFLPQTRRQLEREIRAQFSAYAATGLPLDHANTHKHFHLHPTVARLILEIGRDYGLKAMRVPAEPAGPLAAAGTRSGFGAKALHAWTGQLRRTVRHAGLATSDQTFGIAWSGAMTEDRILSLIPHLPDGVSEIYFHPARTLTPKLARTMPTYRHADELGTLMSPRVRAALEAAGIGRTSFSDLAKAA